MVTRRKGEGHRNWHDVHIMDARWTHGGDGHKSQHEYVPSRGPFTTCQRFKRTLQKLLSNPEKLSWRSNNGFGCTHGWPELFPTISDVANFRHCVPITSQNRDSVMRALDSYLHVAFEWSTGDVWWLHDVYTMATPRASRIRVDLIAWFVKFVWRSYCLLIRFGCHLVAFCSHTVYISTASGEIENFI